MAQQTINIGTTADDGTGDTPRVGGDKINDNFTELYAHAGGTSNPHSVTKTQVGLGNVDNTADADKPVSTATQTALNLKAAAANNVAGDGTITQVVKLTQAAYDALTPVSTTLYVIVG